MTKREKVDEIAARLYEYHLAAIKSYQSQDSGGYCEWRKQYPSWKRLHGKPESKFYFRGRALEMINLVTSAFAYE